MNAEKLKKDFPIFQEYPELVYLDNAATTHKPETVIERIQRFYSEENANIGRSLHDLSHQSTQSYEAARRQIADFIGARKDEIVFTKNTTESVNLVANSLDISGKIVVPETAHHSEQLPWREKARRENLEFEFLPAGPEGISITDAEEIIDSKTSLVSLSHISNVYGNENQVEEIIKLAHDNDALVFLDGAQSVPRKPINVEELGIDFLGFSGHKMLGPTGTGVLYAREKILDQINPYQVGGGTIRTVKKDKIKWEKPPQKFEAGTPNIAGVIGLAEAVNYLTDIGLENIYNHEKELCNQIIEGLNRIQEVNVLSPRNATLVSFTMEGAHPHDISEILNQHNIAIRAGQHCAQPLIEKLDVSATARVSPYIYNTEEDVEMFLGAVREVKDVFKLE